MLFNNAKFKIQNAKFKPPSEEAPEGRALEEVDAEGRRRERPFTLLPLEKALILNFAFALAYSLPAGASPRPTRFNFALCILNFAFAQCTLCIVHAYDVCRGDFYEKSDPVCDFWG